jgi:ubiquinone/menaquinone biosynthesis C-methylase UbiE
MNNPSPDLLEKIRQQFDFGPYPRIPVDKSPRGDASLLFAHNLTIPHYLRYQRVVDTQGTVILDAGCGSGYKSLILAEANPGAKIVGVDLSEASVKLANERLKYHQFENVEFHALSIENLSTLEMEFDYINCDEVLYLLPDPVAGLTAFRTVLKPEGIIRSNLHSSLQRSNFYRVQNLLKLMGLMEDNPEEMEMDVLKEFMQSLKDGLDLKLRTWKPAYETQDSAEVLLANFLLQGDKGSTIPEMFNYLDEAGLEFISMLNWRQWGLLDLFKNPDDLPAFLAISLPEVSLQDQLRMYELLNPEHRLLDFWCGHPDKPCSAIPVSEWQAQDWEQAMIYLNPQLSTTKAKEEFSKCVQEQQPLDMFTLLNNTARGSTFIDTSTVALLMALMEEPYSMASLRDRWLKLQPFDLITMEPVTPDQVQATLIRLLTRLETFLYVLIENQT